MTRKVIIIGGGPAGLASAAAALRRGAYVIMIEAASRLGGQFWRHADPEDSSEPGLQHQWQRFATLRSLITSHPDAKVVTDAQVWAIDHDHGPVVHASVGAADASGRSLRSYRGDALIIATGAHDWTLPFPGWDLPGVYTGGAAQAMAKADGVSVGRKVVVSGSGPFLLPVADALVRVGAEVLGVYEASRVRRLAASWLPHGPWLAPKVPELGSYLTTLVRNKINYSPGRAVIAAHGDNSVTAVTTAELTDDWRPVPGTEQRIACDAVCVSHGFTPRLELPIAAGCAITSDRRVAVGSDLSTSVPGVYAAGESTGIGGADVALAEGSIAGHIAAGGAINDREIGAAVAARRRLQHLVVSLRAGHRIGAGWTDWLTSDTIVCRCEEVPYATLTRVISATQSPGLRSLKLTTRAGLGPCQGRICGRTVEMIMNASDATPTDPVRMDRRPIAAPIRFAELAGDEISEPMRRTHE